MPRWDALDLTSRKLDEMERHLREIYERAEREIGKAWTDYMSKADDRIDQLTKACAEAKKSGDKDAIREAGKRLAGAKQERTIYSSRYQALTQQLAESISHTNEIAAAYINNQLPQIYAMNYNEVASSVNRQLRGFSFDLVDQRTIRRLATTEENLLPYRYVDGKRDVRWNLSKINAEVTQGILQGESMPKIAQRFSAVMDMDATSAIRNARTTVTSAQNKGRMDMMRDADDKGVIMQKGWSCAHDNRVRDWHEELDGVYVGIDEPFVNHIGKDQIRAEIMYPADPDADPANVYNCRCSLVYRVVGFRNPTTGEVTLMDGMTEADVPHSATTRRQTRGRITDELRL